MAYQRIDTHIITHSDQNIIKLKTGKGRDSGNPDLIQISDQMGTQTEMESKEIPGKCSELHGTSNFKVRIGSLPQEYNPGNDIYIGSRGKTG